jgi:hypothetical protein
MYFFTVSGVAATRVSPAMISAGIPICMVNPQLEFSQKRLVFGLWPTNPKK